MLRFHTLPAFRLRLNVLHLRTAVQSGVLQDWGFNGSGS